MVNTKYQEILKLHDMLLDKSIPHVIERDLDGWHINYPCVGKERVLSAVEFKGTYGAEQDLIEIMGLLTPGEFLMDSVKGYLTAENVFDRIKRHYEEHKDEYHSSLGADLSQGDDFCAFATVKCHGRREE